MLHCMYPGPTAALAKKKCYNAWAKEEKDTAGFQVPWSLRSSKPGK